MVPEFQLPFPRNGRSTPFPRTSPEQAQPGTPQADTPQQEVMPIKPTKPTNTGRFGRRQPPPDQGPIPAIPTVPLKKK